MRRSSKNFGGCHVRAAEDRPCDISERHPAPTHGTGAAGSLGGSRAAPHWSAMDHLAPFGATPAKTRVCVDRNRITGGGVTAGIDFALTLVSILLNRQAAEAIQLRLEYDPAPPFNA